MSCNSAYIKLGDQLLQSPSHLFLWNTTQRESQSSPHRAGQMKGDTGQPLVQCQQQQGHPLAGRRELAAGTHGMLPWGIVLGSCHLPQQNTSPQSQREVTQPGGCTAQGGFHSQFSEHEFICDPHTARTTKGDVDSTPPGLSG